MIGDRRPEELGADARALIDAARGAHEPSELSRARVNRSLAVRLAAGALIAGPAASAVAAAAKVTLVIASMGAVVTTAVGVGMYVLPRHTAAPPHAHRATTTVRRTVAVAPPPVAVPAPAPVEPAAAPEPSAAPDTSATRVHRRPHAPTRPAVESVSALRDETALLGAANEALSKHQVERAQSLLDDYDRRAATRSFPGLLAQERRATGILALCAGGQIDAARAEARRFRARWPRSPLAARIDGSCAGRGEGPQAGTAKP